MDLCSDNGKIKREVVPNPEGLTDFQRLCFDIWEPSLDRRNIMVFTLQRHAAR